MLTTGEKVRAYRVRAGKEQKDVAKNIGISEVGFSLKERGKTSFKVEELVKIAAYVGVDVSELIGE